VAFAEGILFLREDTARLSLTSKRLKAGWDDKFLFKGLPAPSLKTDLQLPQSTFTVGGRDTSSRRLRACRRMRAWSAAIAPCDSQPHSHSLIPRQAEEERCAFWRAYRLPVLVNAPQGEVRVRPHEGKPTPAVSAPTDSALLS
jgi:hypothetical protein